MTSDGIFQNDLMTRSREREASLCCYDACSTRGEGGLILYSMRITILHTEHKIPESVGQSVT
jgi:hypothetical protein